MSATFATAAAVTTPTTSALGVSWLLVASSLGGLFVISLAGVLLPLILARRVQSLTFFPLADSFAAGVLCSAAFIHLLPDATEVLELLNINYPVAGALALTGATAVHILDSCSATPSPRHTTYVLASALTIHALLEGLALGASALRRHTFAAILAAVLLHKAFAAMSLGAALASASVPKRTSTTVAFVFAAVTPVSALSALVLVRNILQPTQARLVSAVFTALSAGVFAYVALAELLQNRAHAITSVSHSPLPPPCVYGSIDSNSTSTATTKCTRTLPNGSICKQCAPALSCRCVPKQTAHVNRPSEPLRAAVFVVAAAFMAILAVWT